MSIVRKSLKGVKMGGPKYISWNIAVLLKFETIPKFTQLSILLSPLSPLILKPVINVYSNVRECSLYKVAIHPSD